MVGAAVVVRMVSDVAEPVLAQFVMTRIGNGHTAEVVHV